jgi:hypothetical protein
MHRIDVYKEVTGANADILSGSSLDPFPSDGFARVYAASTVNTATISVEPSAHPNPTGTGTQFVTKAANAEIRSYNPHWETPVRGGEKVAISIAGTTGTTGVWISAVLSDR